MPQMVSIIPAVSVSFEEPGFFGYLTLGRTSVIAGALDYGLPDKIESTKNLKVPTKYGYDGFKVMNPNAPAEVQGMRFDLTTPIDAVGVSPLGRPVISGILIYGVFGHSLKYEKNLTYSVVNIPRESIDGISYDLAAAKLAGYARFWARFNPNISAEFNKKLGYERYGANYYDLPVDWRNSLENYSNYNL